MFLNYYALDEKKENVSPALWLHQPIKSLASTQKEYLN